MGSSKFNAGRMLTMFSLIIAGEAIFTLPFHITRYFRHTFVDVFDFSQTQLGTLQSTYGVIAMVAYIFGGPLADRFPARKLLAFALLVTGSTGFYLLKIPSYGEMQWIYAFWGMSTILPFWAALIRATREWGGHDKQGEAFGILDGGRGLIAAIMATLALFFFSRFFPAVGDATLEQKTAALRSTIYLYTTVCFVAATFVWLFVPEPTPKEVSDRAAQRKQGHLLQVLRMPTVWLQAFIIIGAYCVYKGGDFYSQFARDVWGWSDVHAARISALSVWVRPVAAIGAGLIADRITSSRVIIGCFVLTALTYISFIATPPNESMAWLFWANVLATCTGMFALRGIYYALLEESSIPPIMTGTAVGVIAFIGYTPEIFIPLLGGALIDHWNGQLTGYQVLFAFLCLVSIASILATLLLRKMNRLSLQ